MGHSLVDALIKEVRKPAFQGNIWRDDEGGAVWSHYLVQYKDINGHMKGRAFNFAYDMRTKEVKGLGRFEIPERPSKGDGENASDQADILKAREAIEATLQSAIIDWLPDRQSRSGLQISLVGLDLRL
jgi:hypothetical protein